MKTWFCVTSAIDDSGRTTRAAVTAARAAERRPESGVTVGEREHVYTDWFAGLDKAKAFIAEVCPSAVVTVAPDVLDALGITASPAKEMTT